METIVFTNGCFDVLHPGHIDLLERARALGTKLIVGINSDESVRRIKGVPRPFFGQEERRALLRGLKAVDEVRVFEETTPEKLIHIIEPDVLVKGGDWTPEEIIGADFVLKKGGRVYSLPLKGDFSSSRIVEKIRRGQTSPVGNVAGRSEFIRPSREYLSAHIEVFEKLREQNSDDIEKCAALMRAALQAGREILVCDAQLPDLRRLSRKFAESLEVGGDACPPFAPTINKAAADEHGRRRNLLGQIESQANEGDLLVFLDAAGNSEGIPAALIKARAKNCPTVGLTGAAGKKMAALCDVSILVASRRAAHIREAHAAIINFCCETAFGKFGAE